jgi:hypothetical protein
MLLLRNNNSLNMPLGHLPADYRLVKQCYYSVSPTRGEELAFANMTNRRDPYKAVEGRGKAESI